jgi:MoaA/NifB/PqqE/SkfB family radical SAM enzyme
MATAMLSETFDAELEVDWHLTNRCNFDCEYCHPQIKRVLNRRHLTEPSPETCVAAFDRLGRPCHVSMSGGEPFLFPGFVDLCEGLTRRHVISINTNLSSPLVEAFAARIAPERVVRIAAALHVAERERQGASEERFAEAFRALRERGFPVIALYVLYPPLLHRAAADIERLRGLGVDRIAGKVFKGRWAERTYPEAYTPAEREQVREVAGEYPYNEPYLRGMMRFRGEPCRAGMRSIKVMVTGDVRRCAACGESLGNLYDGTVRLAEAARPCAVNRVLVVSQCLANLVSPPAIPPAGAARSQGLVVLS